MFWVVVSALLSIVLVRTPVFADPGYEVLVFKAQRRLVVRHEGHTIRTYPVSLGRSPEGPKEAFGDMKTPVGRYRIYDKRPSTKFHLFLAINYPELADAERAFQAGRISADVWADIWYASVRRERPPWNTPLGAFVGIHGTGAQGRKARLREVSDWTEGCIALSDRHIEELYALIPVGTPVEIIEGEVPRPAGTDSPAEVVVNGNGENRPLPKDVAAGIAQ